MWRQTMLGACRSRSKTAIIAAMIVVIVTSFTLSSATTLAQAHGTTVAGQACAITPELLLGQGGFALAGQGGFAVTGLGGFAVTGLGGFAVTGLGGFALAGQRGFAVTGLSDLTLEEIEQLIQEIENNTISYDWIQAFMPEISFGDDFYTTKTAVFIIDDFEAGDMNEHGELVGNIFINLQRSANEWLVANGYIQTREDVRIGFFGVDISVDGSYSLDLIASAVQAEVAKRRREGYNHVVLNMSFGLLPCEDLDLNFDFDDFLDERDAAQGPQAVTPIAECITSFNGVNTAHFGYENENHELVEIAIGDNNLFLEGAADRYQVTAFQPGRQFDVFRVDFYGSSVTWAVRGPNGEVSTATASLADSPLCSAYQPASAPVIPHLDCIDINSDGGYKAYFGFENMNNVPVRIPLGENNRFTPAPHQDRGQRRVFEVHDGRVFNAFQVNFTGGVLAWTLEGPDGLRRTAFANSADENSFCPPYPIFDDPFSLYTYLQQRGDDPAAVIGELFDKVDDTPNPLEPLRVLLDGYLQETIDTSNPFQLIAMASSGNYATLVADHTVEVPPLYPARFKETIAVGATLGEGTIIWEGSHASNVVGPGAWYLFSENFAGAGTSYSAPHASMIAALYLTYPDVCVYDADRRPLTAEAAFEWNEVPFLATLSMPLTCFPNNAPEAMDDLAQTTYGASVTVNVLENDSDPNGDTIFVSRVATPPNGTAAINDGATITYTPNPGYPENPGEVVTDTFQYQLNDGKATDTANVTVEINRLSLTAECPTGNFVVHNPGTFAVDFQWSVEGTDLAGQGTAQPGDTAIQTGVSVGGTVNLSAVGVVHDSETPLGPEICLPSVTRLVVVDTDTDQDLYDLTEGLVIDLSRVPGHKINIRAEIGGERMTAASVVFGINENPTYTIDNSAPYTLAPEANGDYDWWRVQPNMTYRLTATPYTGINGTGFTGTGKSVQFTIIESRALSNLLLTATCPVGQFEVTNPNDVAVDFNWTADATGATGSGTVAALADTSFDTGAQEGMVHLYASGTEQDAEQVAVNCAPTFTAVPDTQYNAKRDPVTLQLSATDPNSGDVLTFSAAGLPKGLAIDPATGLISGTVHQSASGEYQVTATVKDNFGAQSSITFLWVIQ